MHLGWTDNNQMVKHYNIFSINPWLVFVALSNYTDLHIAFT